jgi:hypothetical protein
MDNTLGTNLKQTFKRHIGKNCLILSAPFFLGNQSYHAKVYPA